MMTIELDKVSKRYTFHWIIKNLSYTFDDSYQYALLGSNGSGKSTLLKLLSGFLTPSKGRVTYRSNGQLIDRSDIYKKVSFAAPYVSPLKSLTIDEMITFYLKFKNFRNNLNRSEFYEIMQLPVDKTSKLSELSSGQMQRLNLSMAVLADTEILLLDEPGSYLDDKSKIWFQSMLAMHLSNRLAIIASNDQADIIHTNATINIEDYN